MPLDLVRMKELFFDRAAVADKIDPVVRKALSRFGSFVRTRDRSSLRYGKGTAGPGKPPVAHRSAGFTRGKKNGKPGRPASLLKEFIFFAYDPATKSVVIGPVPAAKKVARVIEEGGNGHRPHPHTGPAFRAELGGVGGDFRNCIK